LLPGREWKGARTGKRAPVGFSLVEVMVSTVLVGVGLAAVLMATQSSTTVNQAARNSMAAAYLAEEVREWTLQLAFEDPDGDEGDVLEPDSSDAATGPDDINDLRGAVFAPPRSATGAILEGMPGWSQVITVDWKAPASLCTTVEPGCSDVVRVTVTILRHGEPRYAAAWLAARKTAP
jgi:type II secretory pathway pseudopilin PulG